MFTTLPADATCEEINEECLFSCTTDYNYTPVYINPNTKEFNAPSLFCASIRFMF